MRKLAKKVNTSLNSETRYTDRQLIELLELNQELVELGNDLVASIIKYGKYSKYGKSPHMNRAVKIWESCIANNITRIPIGESEEKGK